MKATFEKNSFNFSVIGTETKCLSIHKPSAEDSWNLHESAFFDPSFLRIWIILRGHGHVLTQNGEMDVSENNAYFLPPHSIVSTSLDEDMEQLYIDFIQDPAEIAIGQLYTFHYQAKPKNFQLLLHLAKSCEPIYKKTDFLSQFTISTTLTTILSHFIKDVSDNSKALNHAIEYIVKNYTKPISITYLANLCDYSPEYFSEKFKRLLGMSPQKFIILKRLAKAKVLLISTHKSVREISNEVGYPDQIHFSKLFSKQIGISPLEYRKNYR